MDITRIVELREKKGLSQSALAEQIGVTRQAVSAYEKGTRQPSPAVIVNIAKALECTTDYILGL